MKKKTMCFIITTKVEALTHQLKMVSPLRRVSYAEF